MTKPKPPMASGMSNRRATALAARAVRVAPGEQFGAWTVLAEGEAIPDKRHKRFTRMMKCRCTCGTERQVRLHDLRMGKSTNCGCIQIRASRERKTEHGGSRTHLHHIWRGIKDRCLNAANSDFRLYGGRGIAVCQEWVDDFAAFAAHVGVRPPRTTLDRIDTDGDYRPGNVRWATAKQQARNTRRTIWVLLRGERLSLPEACERAGVNYRTANRRITSKGYYGEIARA